MNLSPGLHPDLPFEDYLKLRLMSQSVLKEGRNSMAHLKCAWESPFTPPTDDMLIGSALHCAFLEPELLPEKVIQWTGPRRAGKEWESFRQEHESKVILTPGYFVRWQGMVKAAFAHPGLMEWRSKTQGVEVTAIGEIEGVQCRGRCDALTADPLIDLKKLNANTFDRAIGNTDRFLWHARDFGYDIQGALYCRLFQRERWMLAFVRDQPPHCVALVEMGPKILADADGELCALLQAWQHCNEKGEWPGPFDDGTVLVDVSDEKELKINAA